jgi:hypothetical protein
MVVVASLTVACGSSTPTPIYVVVTPAATPTPIIVYITPEPTVTAETASSEASPTSPPAAVAPTIDSTTVTESGTDKCVSWTVTFKKPVVSGVASAATMQTAIDTRVSGLIDAFKAEMPAEGATGACSLDGTYTVSLVSPALLSLRFQVNEYLGGASTTTIADSLNFRVPTGAQIALTELFSDMPATLTILSTRSRSLLPALPEMEGVDTDWIIAGTLPGSMSNFDSAWAMSDTGLVITFQETRVGPVACGTPTVTIKWTYLASVINPAGPAAGLAP